MAGQEKPALKLAIAFALVLMACSGRAEAACMGGPVNWISTPDQSSIVSCWTQATDGDVINVTSGAGSWGVIGFSGKCVSIIGAGVGQTVITLSAPANANNVDMATVACSGSNVMEIAGFTFMDGAGTACEFLGGQCSHLGSFNISGNTGGLYFHDNRIEVQRRQVFNITGYVRGVIRRNYIFFNLNSNSGFIFQVLHSSWLNEFASCSNFTAGCGDKSWATTLTRGSNDQLYIEDNVFESGPNATWWNHDCSDGAREVLRNNTIINSIPQQHDSGRGGRSRGCLNLEMYRNEFRYSNTNLFSGSWGAFGYAGGTGVVFDNRIRSDGTTVSAIADWVFYRQTDGTYRRTEWPWGAAGKRSISSISCSGGTATATVVVAGGNELGHQMIVPIPTSIGEYELIIEGNSVGAYNGQKKITATLNDVQFQFAATCGGTGTGGTYKSAWDENSLDNGYLAQDQPGSGPGPTLIVGCPRFCGSLMTSPYAWSQQTARPIYIWNNFKDTNLAAGAESYSAVGGEANAIGAPVVVANRDVYQDVGASCVSGGACTSGVGRGATLPTTCTAGSRSGQGVGFWLTTGGGDWNTESSALHSTHPATHSLGEDGALYRCSSTNTWTLEMTPAPYPYVISGGSSGNLPPQISITNPTTSSTYNTTASAATFSGSCTDDVACNTPTYICTPACGSGSTSLSGTTWTLSSVSIPTGISTWAFSASDGTLTNQVSLQVYRASACSAVPFTDNFTIGAGNTWPNLGPNWTHYGSTPLYMGIASQAATVNVFAFDVQAFTGCALNSDQYIQATIGNISSGAINQRLCVRTNGSDGQNNNLSGYCSSLNNSGADANNFIYRHDNGALVRVTQAAIDVGTVTPGSTQNKLSVSGDTLTWTVGGTVRHTMTMGSVYTTGTVSLASVGVGASLDSVEVGNSTAPVDTTPPVVTITDPTTDPGYLATESPLPLIEGTALDGATSCQYENNRFPGFQSTTTFSAPDWTVANLPLQIGLNVLTVRCVDAAGNQGTDTLSITYNPAPPPAAPGALRLIF